MSFPFVSIIIPVYNVERFIEQCLDSIAAQDFQGDMECLLIDDCSTDSSVKIIERYLENYHGTIQFHLIKQTKNGGQSAARNEGVRRAKGDYIMFVDSDDYITPNAVSVLTNGFKQHDNVVFVSGLINVDKSGEIKLIYWWDVEQVTIVDRLEYRKSILKTEANTSPCAKLYKSEYVKQVPFREGVVDEDTRFLYDLADVVEEKQLCELIIPERIYYYRIWNGSTIRKNLKEFAVKRLRNRREILIDCQQKHPALAAEFRQTCLNDLYRLLRSAMKDGEKAYYKFCRDAFKEQSLRVLWQSFSWRSLCVVMLIRFFPQLFNKLF